MWYEIAIWAFVVFGCVVWFGLIVGLSVLCECCLVGYEWRVCGCCDVLYCVGFWELLLGGSCFCLVGSGFLSMCALVLLGLFCLI